jgi:hypothetical protein
MAPLLILADPWAVDEITSPIAPALSPSGNPTGVSVAIRSLPIQQLSGGVTVAPFNRDASQRPGWVEPLRAVSDLARRTLRLVGLIEQHVAQICRQ